MRPFLSSNAQDFIEDEMAQIGLTNLWYGIPEQ